MSHRIGDNVDPQRIGLLDGKLLKILVVLTLPFPAIAQVRVVANKDHDAPLIIRERLVIWLSRVSSATLPASASPQVRVIFSFL